MEGDPNHSILPTKRKGGGDGVEQGDILTLGLYSLHAAALEGLYMLLP